MKTWKYSKSSKTERTNEGTNVQNDTTSIIWWSTPPEHSPRRERTWLGPYDASVEGCRLLLLDLEIFAFLFEKTTNPIFCWTWLFFEGNYKNNYSIVVFSNKNAKISKSRSRRWHPSTEASSMQYRVPQVNRYYIVWDFWLISWLYWEVMF